MVQVRAYDGDEEVCSFELGAEPIIVGRDAGADIYLDNRSLSRRHAQIEMRGASIWISDLGSQNGTFVNEERIDASVAIQANDTIRLGSYHLVIDDVQALEDDTPVLTLSGPEGNHRFALVGNEIVLGRAPSCDIAIGHKSISRRHLKISIQGSQYFIEDLGSQNGTRVNGITITKPVKVGGDDKIEISDFTLRIGHLKGDPSKNAQKSTMLIDKSALANAAYMEGDVQRTDSVAGRVHVGHVHENIDSAEASDAGAYANEFVKPAGTQDVLLHDGEFFPASIAASQARTGALTHSNQANPNDILGSRSPGVKPWEVVIEHHDTIVQRLRVKAPFLVIGEDGNPRDGGSQSYIAAESSLILTPIPEGVVVSVAGDRRLLVVDEVPRPAALLRPGEHATLGMLRVSVAP